MAHPDQPLARPADYYAQIESGAAAIGALVAGGDPALPIPTCPDWTLRELAVHVGRVHRWAAQITATRSAGPVDFRSLPDGRFPDEAAARADWLTAGARRAAAAIGAAGQDQVWAFGAMVPASFWARRMCHETLVHAADAGLAAGQEPDLPPALAADAIDEWLTVLMPPRAGQAGAGAGEQALPPGAALHVRAAVPAPGEPAPGGSGRDGASPDGPGADHVAGWVVRHGLAGITVTPGIGEPEAGDVVLAGPAGKLLLVLMRRAAADDPAVTVSGDRPMLARWLDAARF